jgi:K+-sensing histidine kinase KdpD
MTTKEPDVPDNFNNRQTAVLVHDLRQSFTAFIMTADMIKHTRRSLSQEELQVMFEDMRSVVLKSTGLLDGLLCWIKSQKVDFVYEAKPLFLIDLIQEANSSCLNDQLSKFISIYTDIPYHQLIYADKQMLQFINRNILSNATSYSHPESIIRITSSVEDDLITVAFIMDQLEKPFYIQETVDPEDYRHNDVSVVFNICKNLIGQMDGKLWVESVPGAGTTFFYSLPLKKAEPFNLAGPQRQVAEDVEEIKAGEVLSQIDIADAIAYYGITELLDMIGYEKIRLYLDQDAITQHRATC